MGYRNLSDKPPPPAPFYAMRQHTPRDNTPGSKLSPEGDAQSRTTQQEPPWLRPTVKTFGCVIVPLAVLIFGVLAFRTAQKVRYRTEAETAIAKAKSHGLATTLDALNIKYSSTERGRKAVREAADIVSLLRWYPTIVTSGTIQTSASSEVRFDVANIISENSGMSTDSIRLEGVRAHADQNRAVLDRIAALASAPPAGELGWDRSFKDMPPMPAKFRRPGGTTESTFLVLRESARTLLPCAVHTALADNNPKRAYAIIAGWLRLNTAFRSQGTSLVDSMIGVAIDGICMATLIELIKAVPPDREDALWLVELLEPDRMQKQIVYGFETEFVFMSQQLRYMAHETETPAVTLADMKLELKKLGALRTQLVPEMWQAIGDLAWCLDAVREAANSPDRSVADRLNDELEVRIAISRRLNPISQEVVPSFCRAILNSRGRTGQAAMLRAALVLRIAEIDAKGDRAKMPKSLSEVYKSQGLAPPRDYLGKSATDEIMYSADPAKGTFTLTTRKNDAPFEGCDGYTYQGTWGKGQ